MPEQSVTILVVEDDHQIRRVVQGYLEQAGHRVLAVADGKTGLALALSEKPALIVLDLMLPDLDGWEIARRLRHNSDPAIANIYILMLTARVEEADRVEGFTVGADDYMVKPFSPRELTARVQAALRRLERVPAASAAKVLTCDGLRLDPAYRITTLDGVELALTAVEFDLLHALMRQPGRPFTRDELLNVVQLDSDAGAYERTIDVHIKNLRQKLGGSGRHSRFIETVHGVGYRFVS